MSGARILVVDDEPQLRRSLARSLNGHGYDVREAADGAAARREIGAFKPDVVLLDLMLPDANGVDLCKEFRRTTQTPIIVLSIIGDDRAKVSALDEGADDYLTKPFSMDELLARVRVALRRVSADRLHQPAVVEAGVLSIDFNRRDVRIEGEPLHLTPTEFSLLKFLVTNAGKVLTHPMILRGVWGDGYESDSHLLRTYINQLRSKLGAAASYIRTDPGVGYRFEPPES